MAGWEDRFVYGLIDPDTREMRYVGSTNIGMKRPRNHLLPCVYLKDGRRVYRWVREAIGNGRIPEIVIIEYVPTDRNLIQDETGWMVYFRQIGCRLLNATGRAGGTGMTGKHHTEETKRKISQAKLGRKLSEQSRKNIGAASKKRGVSPKTIQKAADARRGKPRSEETKRKCSEALKGVPHTDERKRNTSQIMKKWWENRRALS